MVKRQPAVGWIIPALLMMASATSILATDLYAPSLPHLPEFFGTDEDMVQLTMTLNVLGYAVAQLFYGPLADRLGRRPVMLAGMAGFILFSFACAIADSIEFLIVARVLQGLTACAEAVVALLVIRDLYDEKDSVKLMGIYGMTISMAPAVGPIIGGYIHVWLGWRANFYLLTALAVLVTALILIYLPETGEKQKGAARPGRILRDYGRLLYSREYLSYALPMGAVMGGLFAFITAAPFVLIDLMGVPTQSFGFYQAAIVVAYFLGSMAASGTVGRYGPEPLIKGGLLLVAGGGLLMFALANVTAPTPVLLTAAMIVFAIGLGLVFASAPIRAMDCAPTGRGPSAAMLGSMQMGGAGLGSLTVVILYDGTAWPLVIGVSSFSILALLGYFCLYRPARSPELS